MARRLAWKNSVVGVCLLGASATQALAAGPALSVVASPDPAVQGSPLTLDVVVSDITDLFAYQFSLDFDSAVLQVVSVSQGSFLPAGGSTFFDGGIIDNGVGSLSFVFDSLIGAIPGVSGSGTLATISFAVPGVGATGLAFRSADVLFLDSNLDEISMQIDPIALQAVPVPEPASYLLMALGLAATAAAAARRQRGG